MATVVLPGGATPSYKHRHVVVISISIFLAFFALAAVFTRAKFPAERVGGNLQLFILAYSIYVAVLCGLAVLMVEQIRVVYGAVPLAWKWPIAFVIYLSLTVIPVVYATFVVSEQAALLVRPIPGTSTTILEQVKHDMGWLAPFIVFIYLLADFIGLVSASQKKAFARLVAVDVGVLVLHGVALSGIANSLFGGFSQSELAGFSAGVIGAGLIGQNIAFAIITSFRV